MTINVLFVDDDPGITRSAVRILRKEPYEVMTANSAMEALAAMEAVEVDIIVSDEQMPEVSGLLLLRKVRERYPDTVPIMLTGEANLETAVGAINDASIFRFLNKPCTAGDLKACLAAATERVDEQRELRESAQLGTERLSAVQDRDEKEARFDSALEKLWVALQPIIREGEAVYGFEALVRTDEPSVPHPGVFFDLADELERTIELERCIRSRIPALVATAPADAVFFVNVAPHSLSDEQLYDENAPLSTVAGRVVLEVTERSSLNMVDSLPEKMAALRKLGFRIAVDDLGSGYAGLTTFTALHPDIVKFDMGLIRDIHKSPTKHKLLRALSAVCRELDIMSVAEGVETVEELDCLLDIRCNLYQGFLFARPSKPFPTVNWPGDGDENSAESKLRKCA